MIEENDQNLITEKINIIDRYNFYFDTPLYESLEYSQIDDVENLFCGDVDAYSAVNDSDTTYSVSSKLVIELNKKYVDSYTTEYRGFSIVTLRCKRKDNDILRFFVYNDEIDKLVMKVGQFPSIADIQFSDLERKYKNVLAKQYLSEFKKAIVSASHGYGVAAFVYLRRIFENLIFEAFKTNVVNFVDITEDDFINKRMEEKIDILKMCLPSQLIEMKSIYVVLSMGVHKLDEDVCLEYFHPLKLSIELILDQKIEENIKKKRDEDVKKQLQHIHTKLASAHK